MKYLTEDDLRLAYRDNPFETFTIQKLIRLTPGARTFLMDRKIRIIDENNPKPKKRFGTVDLTSKEGDNVEQLNSFSQPEWMVLCCETLKIAHELAELDFSIAEELSVLGQQMASIPTNGDSVISNGLGLTNEVPVDKSYIISNFSRIGFLLKTEKGKIVTQLYSLYFKIEDFITKQNLEGDETLQEVSNRLAQMIAHHFKK